MKQLLLILLLALPLLGYSQRITTNVKTETFGPLECKYKMSAENNDTSYYIYCGFRNVEYTHIVDIGSIGISNQIDLDKLVSNLEKAIPLIEAKTTATFSEKRYDLRVYDFAKALYIYEGSKNTKLTIKQTQLWIDWLKTIQFPES